MHNEKIFTVNSFSSIDFSGHFQVPTICIYRNSVPILRYDKGLAACALWEAFRRVFDASAFLDAAASTFAANAEKVGDCGYGRASFGGVCTAYDYYVPGYSAYEL